jgi:DNA-binding SARP family transcriptional activator
MAYAGRFVDLVLRCANAARDGGDPETALGMLEKATEAAPLEEPLCYQMMTLLSGMGKPAEAKTIFEQYRHRISTGIAGAISSRLLSLYRTLEKNKDFS